MLTTRSIIDFEKGTVEDSGAYRLPSAACRLTMSTVFAHHPGGDMVPAKEAIRSN